MIHIKEFSFLMLVFLFGMNITPGKCQQYLASGVATAHHRGIYEISLMSQSPVPDAFFTKL